MDKYLNLIVQHLSETEQQLENKFEQFSHSYGASVADDALSDEIWTVQQYPKFLYSSFVVLWYSFIEQRLFHLCHELDRELWQLLLNKNPYPALKDAGRYLVEKGFQGIDGRNWQELTKISKLRNILVHRGNEIWITHRKPDEKYLCLSERDQEDIPGLREWTEHISQIDRELEFPAGTVSEADNLDTLEWYIREKDVNNRSLYRYLKEHKLLTCEGKFLTISPGIDYCRHLIAFGRDLFQEILSYVQKKKSNDIVS